MFQKEKVIGVNGFRIGVRNDMNMFSFESKRCFKNVDSQETVETKSEKKDTYDETTVNSIQEDVKQVQETLDKKFQKMFGLAPFALTTFSHNQIMEGTGQEKSYLPFKKVGDLWDSTSILLKGAGETAVNKLKEVTHKELVLEAAVNELTNTKEGLEARKEQVLALRKATQNMSSRWNYINPIRPITKAAEGIGNWKFNRQEIKGTEKKIKVLEKHKNSATKERESLEAGIQKALSKQFETRDQIIGVFESLGLEKEDAELILKAIAKGEIIVSGNLDFKIGRISGDADKKYQNKLAKILNPLKKKLEEQNVSDTERKMIASSLNTFKKKGAEKMFAFEENVKKRENYNEDQSELQALKELTVGSKNVSLKRFKTQEFKFKGNYEVLSNKNGETLFVRTDPKDGILEPKNFIVLSHETSSLSSLRKVKENPEVKKYLKEERSNLEQKNQKLQEEVSKLAFANAGDEAMKEASKKLKKVESVLEEFKKNFEFDASKTQKKFNEKLEKQNAKDFKEEFKDLGGLKMKEQELADLKLAYEEALDVKESEQTSRQKQAVRDYLKLELEVEALRKKGERGEKIATKLKGTVQKAWDTVKNNQKLQNQKADKDIKK